MKAQVATTVSPESGMLLKTISCDRGACGWEPRWEPPGRTTFWDSTGHEQRVGTRPRSRTDLNGYGCPDMELRIRRS